MRYKCIQICVKHCCSQLVISLTKQLLKQRQLFIVSPVGPEMSYDQLSLSHISINQRRLVGCAGPEM